MDKPSRILVKTMLFYTCDLVESIGITLNDELQMVGYLTMPISMLHTKKSELTTYFGIDQVTQFHLNNDVEIGVQYAQETSNRPPGLLFLWKFYACCRIICDLSPTITSYSLIQPIISVISGLTVILIRRKMRPKKHKPSGLSNMEYSSSI